MALRQGITKRPWLCFISLAVFAQLTPAENDCSRSLSRTVRSVLKEHFYPVFQENDASVPVDCPLHELHDVYGVQEGNKTQEYAARWKCEFCGKAFFTEHYLDKHFVNKHDDMVVKGASVCLADYCDVFRCSVLNAPNKDRFWEKALCKEDEMAVWKMRCEALIHGCHPQGNISLEAKTNIQEAITKNTCSLLNCKDYWKSPYEEIPSWKIVLFAVVTPFFLIGLMVYYYSLWEYYFGETFDYGNSSENMEENTRRYRSVADLADLRRRYAGHVHSY